MLRLFASAHADRLDRPDGTCDISVRCQKCGQHVVSIGVIPVQGLRCECGALIAVPRSDGVASFSRKRYGR